MELLDLLTQEDVKRDVLLWVKTFRSRHSRKLFLVVLLNEVLGKLTDQILLKLLSDFVFLGSSGTTAAFLGHSIDQGVDHALGFVKTESEISGNVESEDDRGVLLWEGLDVLVVLLDLGEVRDCVGEVGEGVEIVVLLDEDSILKPQGSVSLEHLTIEIISDTASILHIADDELDGSP